MITAWQRRIGVLIYLACLLPLLNATLAQADDSVPLISLPWTERRPFQYLDESGRLTGLLHGLGESIFTAADIPGRWDEIPANRIARMLEDNQTPLCLVGWFRTPERERIAHISAPIYRDKPLRGIVPNNSAFRPGMSLDEIMNNSRTRLIIKRGYSYGVEMDAKIAARQGAGVEGVVVDNAKLLLMVKAHRADITFLPQEEVDYYTKHTPGFAQDFAVLSFDELPLGNTRHVVCSKQVHEAVMKRINTAIAKNLPTVK